MIYKALYDKLKACSIDDNSDNDIVLRLNIQYTTLFECLNKTYFHSHKVYESKQKLHDICDSIIEVIRKVESGNRSSAFDQLYELYFGKDNGIYLNICDIKAGTSFYRMRSADNYTQYTKNTEDEMYHIPFNKRYLIGNERYSLTGFPTFYLSPSIYSCWEECNRCNLDFSNVALFKNTDRLQFLDMVLPKPNSIIYDNTLLWIPLILASRLKVIHDKGKFVPKYIIPQLLMECVIKSRRDSDSEIIIGTRYESIHQSERDLIFDNFYKDDLFLNYAIPPFESSNRGVCKRIKELFEFWANTSWAEMQYKDPMVDVTLTKDELNKYNASRFGVMEKFLGRISLGMLTYKTKSKTEFHLEPRLEVYLFRRENLTCQQSVGVLKNNRNQDILNKKNSYTLVI